MGKWYQGAKLDRHPRPLRPFMPRSLRIEFPGAYYHVMARGNRRETIFHDDDDRRFFLATLSEACAMTGWRVHAWVLMGNHYHLFIETPEANLVAGMSWLQNTVTRRYNVRHQAWGRLFGDRYKAVLVEGADTYHYRTLADGGAPGSPRSGGGDQEVRDAGDRKGCGCPVQPFAARMVLG